MDISTALDRVTITLPPQLRERLDRFAFDSHRSRSNAVALLLAEALDHRADTVPVEPHRITMESQHHDCR
ncbi:MAG: hypothetical protein M0038_06840 [Pseudomonadota bacterium]|nr:hypothetical protein [Pseudomonadota bacterium]